MTSSLLTGLNPQQLEAITLPHQSALVLAGAGSGKTRVLTTRIAYLIQSGQASPYSILAVTFTNKAAKEMLTRINAMMPVNTRRMWIGTFHGLCNRLLRAHYQEAGLPQAFQILDTADQLAMIKRILKSLSVDDKRFPPRQVQWFINHAKEAGQRAANVIADDPFSRHLLEFYLAYEQQCNREGVADFAELLLRSYELLSRNEILRDHYRERFDHILVDEFQDTNRLQYDWLRLLAGIGSSHAAAVFVVGDDDQSIYAFRGADTGNMRDFERDFGISTIIKLEQNYRSHGNILGAANALIEYNTQRLGKNLWTAEGEGEPIRVYRAFNDIDEASFIVDEVQALRVDGVPLAEIALLYRSNAQSRVLEHCLFNAALPYRVYGGMRFFERMEIKHALAYLRLVANPEDDNALLRVINFPARGIGARSLEQLQDAARKQDSSLWAAALQQCGDKISSEAETESNAKNKKGVAGFVALVLALRQNWESMPLPQIVERVLLHSGLVPHYKTEKEGADRLENLHELVNAAISFVHEADDDSLTAFLAHASLEAGEHQAGSGQDALQLMTVHAAKGLEFHSVFLSGLEEGLFPHDNSLNETNGLEEERRLMYVAMTRARRRLYLSLAQSRMLHGQTRYNIASRFLEEIPKVFLKWIKPPVDKSVNLTPLSSGTNSLYTTSSSAIHTNKTYRQPFPTSGQWQIGQAVTHAKFGEGIILNYEGSGSEARVQVNFAHAGTKWLMLEYAKLTPV
ncbi:UvrD-helicase domain-containing protein [Nitrosomonas sp.]|uniref:UvrD-helicase domain-containing protein n=1 Tax=Nitrosomonas sp. TaxID=42353 RepID=UPI00283BB528|nr:UvrD-helicase domain-containing protein [Nitrosomonas sp.]MDR4513075.1 UvrD-helicase domain-containing protein [Nitrosomonas sp.]